MLGAQAEVWESCLPFWEGFTVLSRSRPWHPGPHGGQPGYIPYSEIAAYARDHDHGERSELDLFVYLIQQLDEVYIAHARKVAETIAHR